MTMMISQDGGEVIDRTTGEVVPVSEWSYDSESGDLTIHGAKKFHDYTVSFLAYIMWGSGAYVQCGDKWMDRF